MFALWTERSIVHALVFVRLAHDRRFVGVVLLLFLVVVVVVLVHFVFIRISGWHCVAHDHEGTPVDQPGRKFLGDVWDHVVAPRAWTLGDAANRGGLTGCVVLRPPEPKAAPRHGHQLARS